MANKNHKVIYDNQPYDETNQGTMALDMSCTAPGIDLTGGQRAISSSW